MESGRIIVPAAFLVVMFVVAMILTTSMSQSALGQASTPSATYSCETMAAGGVATPAAMDHDTMGAMEMASPAAGMEHMAMDVGQMYIDMMIPHHQSIIAMAQAALPSLEDERLREIAQAIIATQQPEIDELRSLREAFYGTVEPMPMDDSMMTAMDEMLPGMSGTMDEMAFQMDTAAQVAAICAANDVDLTFIDLTIPHHQMAIEASEALLEQTEQPELRDFAERVIVAQQAEIDQLTEIRAELFGATTPANP